MNTSIILASASPRRRELLALTALPFDVHPVDVDETLTKDVSPAQAVMMLSARKAKAAAEKFPGRIILAADTLVALGDTIFGKPIDGQDARRMLRMLSGNTHTVYTGVSIINENGSADTFVDMADVTFFELTDEEIDAYVETGEPMDKAGSYGIQEKGRLLVAEIHGNYDTIVGLPIGLVWRKLKAV